MVICGDGSGGIHLTRLSIMAQLVARERGISVDQLLGDLEQKRNDALVLRTSDTGKYRVLGIDRFSDDAWVHDEYGTAEKALEMARSMT